MRAKLQMVEDNDPPRVIKVKTPMTIGRGREANLTLAHALISRQHCELYEVDGVLCIRDLGSLNGTYVGDIRVTEAALESGDILAVGSFRFEVMIEEEESADAFVDDGSINPDEIEEIDESQLESFDDLEPMEDVADSSPPPAAIPETEMAEEEEDAPLMPPPLSGSGSPTEELPEALPEPKGAEAEEVEEIEELDDLEDLEDIEEVDDLAEVDPEEVVEAEEAADEPPAPKTPPPAASQQKPVTRPAPAPKGPQAQPTPAGQQPPAPQQSPAPQQPAAAPQVGPPQNDTPANDASDANLNEFLKGL